MDGKIRTSRGTTALGGRYLFLEIEKDCSVAGPTRINRAFRPRIAPLMADMRKSGAIGHARIENRSKAVSACTDGSTSRR